MSKGLHAIYAKIAGSYELVNRILTFGFDVRWRSLGAAAVLKGGGTRFLDMCTGTGETAVNIRRRVNGNARVYGCDFSESMLAEAKRKPRAADIRFVQAEADALPFPDDYFDAVSITFATRNLNSGNGALVRRFSEVRRVLKPGGRFINLETSQPPSPLIGTLFRLYVGGFVRPIGRLISGNDPGYAYLASSIPRFHGADELALILLNAGFSEVSYRRLTFGAAAVHTAIK